MIGEGEAVLGDLAPDPLAADEGDVEPGGGQAPPTIAADRAGAEDQRSAGQPRPR